MNGHHLILGQLTDYLTGETLEDTHDERYRQKLACFLVEQKGYLKTDITSRHPFVSKAGEKKAMTRIDFLVTVHGKIAMLIKYGPGSLVTRRRPALAASRLLADYQVPLVVVTNGKDAEVMDGASGKVSGTGLGSLPERGELENIVNAHLFKPISTERAEMESRIFYAYEVDGCCPCDETVCKMP